VSLLTAALVSLFQEIQQSTTHRLRFYEKDFQVWFKNATTSAEAPIPIALLEAVTLAKPQSEARRLAFESLKIYVEKLPRPTVNFSRR